VRRRSTTVPVLRTAKNRAWEDSSRAAKRQ
jgi:hypothetical protein